MYISALSASRGKTYMTCPRKHYLSYEKGIKADAIHLDFGTLIHSVLENWFKDGGNILDIYENEWQKGNVTDFQYYTDGKEMLLDFISKHDREKIDLISTEHAFDMVIEPEYWDESCEKCNGTGKIAEENRADSKPNLS